MRYYESKLEKDLSHSKMETYRVSSFFFVYTFKFEGSPSSVTYNSNLSGLDKLESLKQTNKY